MTDLPPFPQNIIVVLAERFGDLMVDHEIVMRAVRTSDPAYSVGLFTEDWAPVVESTEIPSREPTLSRYTVKIHNLVKSADEAQGRGAFAVNAKIIRGILYRDTTLHANLRALSEEMLGTQEQVKRFGVTRQKYLTGTLTRQWTFLATTDFWVETEATPL